MSFYRDGLSWTVLVKSQPSNLDGGLGCCRVISVIKMP